MQLFRLKENFYSNFFDEPYCQWRQRQWQVEASKRPICVSLLKLKFKISSLNIIKIPIIPIITPISVLREGFFLK